MKKFSRTERWLVIGPTIVFALFCVWMYPPAFIHRYYPLVLDSHIQQSIEWLRYSPDGSKLVGTSDDFDANTDTNFATMTVWDTRSGKMLWQEEWTPPVNPYYDTGPRFSPDSLLVVHRGPVFPGGKIVPGTKTVTQLWDARNGQIVSTLPFLGDQLFFLPDGKQLVGAGSPLAIWDLKRGRLAQRFPKINGTKQLSFSGRKLIAASEDIAVRDKAHAVRRLVPDANGRGTWTTDISAKYQARLYQLDTGSLVCTLPGISEDQPDYRQFEFSGDGKRLLTTSHNPNHATSIWDTANGKLMLALHSAKSDRAVFSPNGQTVACADSVTEKPQTKYARDRSCRLTLFDSYTGKVLWTRTLAAVVEGLAFSPDGRLIASRGSFSAHYPLSHYDYSDSCPGENCNDEWQTLLWNAQTGELLRVLRDTYVAEFSPDSSQIAVSHNSFVHLYKIDDLAR